MNPTLRVLVVDDSVVNRFSIEAVLRAHDRIEVIGHAKNGEEALQIALTKKPDVITLDIEMPKMDGFTFLRILMSKQPTPVIVVSSYGSKETVFRALELGALDFVARAHDRPDDQSVLQQIVAKVLLARSVGLLPHATYKTPPLGMPAVRTKADPTEAVAGLPIKHLVVIAASTGGPSALMEIFDRLPAKFPGAVLVAQHMPDRFTKTFAERLDRRSSISVQEAKDLDVVMTHRAFVCPGGLVTTVRAAVTGTPGEIVVMCGAPTSPDRYAPSADLLMESAAKVGGARTLGVILTGMGDDGVKGARAIRAAGGKVIVESEETAIVNGMPGAAVRAKAVDRVMRLGDIAAYLANLA